MSNPYQLDPNALQKRTQAAQEERLITLKDDSTQPPPSVGTPIFQSIVFGPMAGQPSKATEDDVPAGWGKLLFRAILWLWAILIGASLLYRILQ